MKAGDSSANERSSVTRKTRIKNAKRIKNAANDRNHYQQAKFPVRGIQSQGNSRTSSSGDELSSSSLKKNSKQNDRKEHSSSIKRSERIKVRKRTQEFSDIQKCEKEDFEDHVSDVSSISDVSSLHSDVSKRRTPISANKYVFKSKRLQELQEKTESKLSDDVSMIDKDNLREFQMEAKTKKARTDSESEKSSHTMSRQQSLEDSGVWTLESGGVEDKRPYVNSEDEGQSQELPAALKKRKVSGKKAPVSRIKAMRNDSKIPSSSEDEESSKPLSEIKKEIEKSPKEPTERVVKKVIKVVKKIRTKNGETKTKVVKIIKKMGVRKKPKDTCSVITGRRRVRCGTCKGCRIKEDCGICRWCM